MPVRSASAFSEWQGGGHEYCSGSNSRWQSSTTNPHLKTLVNGFCPTNLCYKSNNIVKNLSSFSIKCVWITQRDIWLKYSKNPRVWDTVVWNSLVLTHFSHVPNRVRFRYFPDPRLAESKASTVIKVYLINLKWRRVCLSCYVQYVNKASLNPRYSVGEGGIQLRGCFIGSSFEELRSKKVHVHKFVRPKTQTLNRKKIRKNLSFHYYSSSTMCKEHM